MKKEVSHRILVVDDEDYMRDILSRWLSAEGYACSTAGEADQALALCEQEPFALLVSDINMPGRSGIELLTEARRRFQDLAVIMATAVDDRRTAIHTLELGAYGYVIKPFERNEILINVANALRLRELEIENRQYREGLEQMVLMRTQELRNAINQLTRTKRDLQLSRE
ncbi:MAG: response regulator, partial [Thermodesulfobacteriota bacterium]